MKRPKKITNWFPIEQAKSEWVDWNGKPAKEYYIKIPYWLARAYMRGNINRIQVTFHDQVPCARARDKRSTDRLMTKYFRENWSRKVTKMRKLNGNYMKIETVKR